MAIKIRCVDCKKKISIDEAFAGGVCRCPYCTAIVYVSDDSGATKRPVRPDAPTRRPESPTAATQANISKEDTAMDVPALADSPGARKAQTQDEADKALAAAHGQAHIPTAAPVKIQGIVSIVLSVLLLVMIAVMVMLAIHVTKPDIIDVTPKDYEYTVFTTRGDFPAVAGTIRIQAPVVYCIDTSRPMSQVLESAGKIVIASAKSLEGGKFNLILLGEDDDKVLNRQLIAADEAGIAKADAFLTAELCGAAEQARGLRAALAMNARTVVLLARDSDPGAKDVARGAFKDKSVPLHTIVLGGSDKGLAEMAKLTGGQSKSYTTSDLEAHARRAAEQPKKQ